MTIEEKRKRKCIVQSNIRHRRRELGLCMKCGQRPKQKGKRQCRECTIRDALRRRNVKRKVVEYLGGKCVVCGLESTIYAIYDLHHTRDKTKGYSCSRLFSKKFTDIKSELDKCLLLCANCHRILHSEEDDIALELYQSSNQSRAVPRSKRPHNAYYRMD